VIEVERASTVPDGWTFTGGTEVVVQGAQMLLSEEFRAQVQAGEEGTGK